MIQHPRHFILQEFFSKAVFEKFSGEPDKLWGCIDARVLWTADHIRMRYGPMVANNWHTGGPFQNRGFRPFELNLGAPLSQHKFGRALDLDPVDVPAEEIRKDILEQTGLDEFRYIRCIEEGTSWLHFDVRNWVGPVLVVQP